MLTLVHCDSFFNFIYFTRQILRPTFPGMMRYIAKNIFTLVNRHPGSRGFLNSTRKKGLCRNREKSVLSMRKPLLGNSFKPRPSLDCAPRRHVDFPTEGSILSFSMSKIWCAHCLKRFDRSYQKLGLWRLKILDTFSTEPFFLTLWRVLERLCSPAGKPIFM